jgi:anti-sigma B factor antagonist
MNSSRSAAGHHEIDDATLLERVASVADAVVATHLVEEAIAAIVLEARDGLRADRAATWVYRDGRFDVIATSGLKPDTVDRFEQFHVPESAQAAGAMSLLGERVLSWSSTDEALEHFRGLAVQRFGSGIAVPLLLRGEIEGVLFVGWDSEGHAANPDERTFLRALAEWGAIAFERDELRRERDELASHPVNSRVVHQSDMLRVTCRPGTGARAMLLLEGELDLSNADTITLAVADLFDTGVRGIVLELADVSYIDATSIRALVEAANAAKERDITLELHQPSPLVRRLLHMANAVWMLADEN